MPCSKGMRSCRRGCLHRSLVLEYRDARDAWIKNREQGEAMQMEDDEYAERFPPPTFKEWIIQKGGEKDFYCDGEDIPDS